MITLDQLEEKRKHALAQLNSAEREIKRLLTISERYKGALELIDILSKEIESNGADKQESLPGSDEKEVKVVDLQDVRFQETKVKNAKADEMINYHYEGTD